MNLRSFLRWTGTDDSRLHGGANFARGLAMLERLRDDQCQHVRHLLRSWTREALSEGNIHLPICRYAIERTLRDRP